VPNSFDHITIKLLVLDNDSRAAVVMAPVMMMVMNDHHRRLSTRRRCIWNSEPKHGQGGKSKNNFSHCNLLEGSSTQE
jgi:hypothetical protein